MFAFKMTSPVTIGLKLAFLAITGLLLAACEVEAENPTIAGTYCPQIYAPVCAERNDELRTFPNACEARSARWRIIADGQCRAPDWPQQRLCPQVYDPVCATRGSRERTFGNACEAREAGWRIAYGGECRRRDWPEPRLCPQIYDPICATRGSSQRTFPNACEAKQQGWRYIYGGECRSYNPPRNPPAPPVQPPPPPPRPKPPQPPQPPAPPPGQCPPVIDQVCGQLDGQAIRFNNECEMRKAGATRVADGLCMGGNR